MRKILSLLIVIALALPVSAAYYPTIRIGDGANLDAFSRIRVSETTNLFDSIAKYNDDPLLWESIANGGSATHQAGSVSVRLSTGGTTAGYYAMRQSKIYHSYRPGKSQLALLTFTPSAAQTNALFRIGYFDHSNGFFLERDGTTVNLVRRNGTATDLVTNGKFTSDAASWTGSGATLARTTVFGDGELSVTNSGAAIGYAYQAITTTPGTRYTLSVVARRNTASTVGIGAGTTSTGMELAKIDTTNTGDTAARQGDTLTVTFTASGATTYITLYNNDTTNGVIGVFDWVTLRASDDVVAQASWNIDPMTAGTGPSGKTLDLTKSNILVIDFQYLGVGRCRIGFDIDGVVYYVHQFTWANLQTGVYNASGGSCPVRAEVMNGVSAAGGTVTLDWHCASVMSEGGKDDPFTTQFGVNNGAAGSGAIGAERTIIGVRSGYTYNGLKFRGQIRPVGVEISAITNNIIWGLYLNTVAAVTWAPYNATYSGAETTTSVVAVTTPGVLLQSGIVAASAASRSTTSANDFLSFPIVHSSLKNTQDSLLLVATPFTGNATVNATLVWREEK